MILNRKALTTVLLASVVLGSVVSGAFLSMNDFNSSYARTLTKTVTETVTSLAAFKVIAPTYDSTLKSWTANVSGWSRLNVNINVSVGANGFPSESYVYLGFANNPNGPYVTPNNCDQPFSNSGASGANSGSCTISTYNNGLGWVISVDVEGLFVDIGASPSPSPSTLNVTILATNTN